MVDLIENGPQLLEQAKQHLQKDMIFLPFKDEVVSAVALCRPFSVLDSFLREVASGYLDLPVYQEVCVNVMDAPIKANKFYETYQGKRLVITKADSLEEKILNFSRVYFIVDVTVFKLLTASPKWEHLLDFCRHNRNHFLVFGTLINDKYVHHGDIPALDIMTLVPQFLIDTGEPQELEVGEQLLKIKKNGIKK